LAALGQTLWSEPKKSISPASTAAVISSASAGSRSGGATLPSGPMSDAVVSSM
jgi:hypothetical protein